MILIAGIGIASAVDVQPSHPSFKWMNEDTNPVVDVPFTNSKVQEYRSTCSTCGPRPDVPLIRSQVQEQDAPVAPLAIRDAAPQGSVLPIKPREIPTPAPFVKAEFDLLGCQPRYGESYDCMFVDLSEAREDTPIALWEWDFSDGSLLSYYERDERPWHQFQRAGDYVVILRVSNEFNTSTTYKVVTVPLLLPLR